MTIKEFSQKYGVPYTIAFSASYHVKPIETIVWDKDFPEKDLYEEVAAILKRRVEYHRDLLQKDIKALNNMGIEVNWNELPKV